MVDEVEDTPPMQVRGRFAKAAIGSATTSGRGAPL